MWRIRTHFFQTTAFFHGNSFPSDPATLPAIRHGVEKPKSSDNEADEYLLDIFEGGGSFNKQTYKQKQFESIKKRTIRAYGIIKLFFTFLSHPFAKKLRLVDTLPFVLLTTEWGR